LKIANLLESQGKFGQVTMIDGSAQFVHKFSRENLQDASDDNIQSKVILRCIQLLFPDDFLDFAKKVLVQKTWETRLDEFMAIFESTEHNSQYSTTYGRKMLTSLVQRIKIIIDADKIELPKLKCTPISLIKPKTPYSFELDEDYGLGKFSNEKVNVTSIDGDHATILKNAELLKFLMN
jgi:hypothetical protein